ncbi:hypothetical protein [Halomonas sp. PA16-9]|uniref:hypothetical protein n=1 Tax=Halomonas sp. PA16-9 TaxID=2576841 RepID=UPI0030EE0E69
MEREWFSNPETFTPVQRAPWHTLRLGQRLTETWVEWVEEVMERGLAIGETSFSWKLGALEGGIVIGQELTSRKP